MDEISSVKERLTRIEIEVEALYKAVERMQSSATALTSEVRNIQRSLNQIKYFAMGVAFIYAANTLGLPIALKFIGV